MLLTEADICQSMYKRETRHRLLDTLATVSVAQEELNSFLAVAEELRVKGLTQSQPSTILVF